MKQIKKDYMRKELGRLVFCAAGFAACLLVLWRYYERMASCRLQVLLAIAAVIGLAALRSALQARAAAGRLTDHDSYLLEKEYAAPHPVYKVWQGEMHLMESFIVCRSRGRLLFIPVHKIERAERRFDRIGMLRIPYVKFILDTGRSAAVGFSPNHFKDSGAVFTWLEKRLGREKVPY